VRIRVVDGVNMDVRDVPLLMAFDELTAAGHDVQPTYIAGNTLLADTMARGEAEVGIINNQTAWAAVASGADIRTVSEFTAYTGLIAAGTGVQSCHDLHERPVAVPVTTGFAPLMFNLHLRITCPDATPQILVIAEAPSRRAALIAGRIDAAQLPGEQLIALQHEVPGRYHALSVPSREFPGVRVDGLQVRGAWARENPGVVRMLLAAQLRAHRRIRANPALLYEEAARRLKLDPDAAKVVADAHLQQDIWPVNGGLTPGNVQSTIDFLVESGGLPAGVTADGVSDLSYLDAVLTEIGRDDSAPGGSTQGAPSP
jgi:ABC-type nitrate/sulfonate/bicarbonate transport system substrate-binding protein